MGKRCVWCMQILKEGKTICHKCGHNLAEYEQPEFALLPETQLHAGKYLVGKVLGQGGFGITYVGLDQSLELKVAIKEYFPTGMASRSTGTATLQWRTTSEQHEAGRESFVKEARKMAKIHRIPNVVEVRDVFYENDTAYIVMDFVEGETLKDRLAKTGPMSETDCVALLRPVMEALGKAHERNIIHRDISPDNIMIDRNGVPWLLDMGAAKELDFASGGAMQSSQLVVKHGFSPPEQSASAGKIGPWTDVYAMCATIYYCMTGKLLPDAMDRMLGTPLVLPSLLSGNLTTALESGLALRPEERIQSMGELMTALASPAGFAASMSQTEQKDTGTEHEEAQGAAPLDKEEPNKAIISDKTDEGSAFEQEKRKKTLPRWLIPVVGGAAVLVLVFVAVGMSGDMTNSDSGAVPKGTVQANAAADIHIPRNTEGATALTKGGADTGDAVTADETLETAEDVSARVEGQQADTPASQPPAQESKPESAQQSASTPQEETYVTNRFFKPIDAVYGYTYTGGVSNDIPNGKGTATYTNGNKYMGEFKNGWPDGTGTMDFADGGKYEGKWKDGGRSGIGIMTYADGDKYEGEWEYDVRSGTGIMAYADGGKYEGEWEDDEKSGAGTMIWPNGDKYEGEWYCGRLSGTGTYIWASGAELVGEWQDNEYISGWDSEQDDLSQEELDRMRLEEMLDRMKPELDRIDEEILEQIRNGDIKLN